MHSTHIIRVRALSLEDAKERVENSLDRLGSPDNYKKILSVVGEDNSHIIIEEIAGGNTITTVEDVKQFLNIEFGFIRKKAEEYKPQVEEALKVPEEERTVVAWHSISRWAKAHLDLLWAKDDIMECVLHECEYDLDGISDLWTGLDDNEEAKTFFVVIDVHS